MCYLFFFFFFSSRRRHTRYWRDWSSDVCSSDLGHFSFNIPGGRCETCQGDGTVTVEMQFLADVELICEECKGTRYKPGVLEVRYKGKNIHEVLNLTVREALQFFAGVPKVTDKLRVLEEIGLGYLRLGQSATTLSGGEAQRMKLAAHLAAAGRPRGFES